MNSSNATTMDQVRAPQTVATDAESTQNRADIEGTRVYRSLLLDQLPGAAFAAVTLVWVISSFGHLIW